MGRPKGSKNLDQRHYQEKVEAVLRFLHKKGGTNAIFSVTNEEIGLGCGFHKPWNGTVKRYLTTLQEQGKIAVATKKVCLSENVWINTREIFAFSDPCPAMTPEEKERRDFELKYGITLKEYDEILEKQRGACAICRGPPNGPGKKTGRYSVHEVGNVRGLLCYRCKIALGYFRNSVSNLQSAVKYLQPEL